MRNKINMFFILFGILVSIADNNVLYNSTYYVALGLLMMVTFIGYMYLYRVKYFSLTLEYYKVIAIVCLIAIFCISPVLRIVAQQTIDWQKRYTFDGGVVGATRPSMKSQNYSILYKLQDGTRKSWGISLGERVFNGVKTKDYLAWKSPRQYSNVRVVGYNSPFGIVLKHLELE